MKKNLFSIICGFSTIPFIQSAASWCIGCTTTPSNDIISIHINRKNCNLSPGDTIELFVTVLPENASHELIIWETSNPEIATINKDGKVQAHSVGYCIITAKTKEGKCDTCSVSVTNENVKVTGLKLSKKSIEFNQLSDSEQITANILPANATNKEVVWWSDNNNIAKVVDGLVTPVSKTGGACNIYAKTIDGGFSDCCSVKIEPKYIPVQSIKFEHDSQKIKINETIKLEPIITPSNASNKEVVWWSDNNNIAEVNNGLVKPTSKSGGTCKIYAKTSDGGFIATCNLTVATSEYIPIKEIRWTSGDAFQIEENQKIKLNVEILPSNATCKKLTWTSTNNSVADVDSNGLVTGISSCGDIGACSIKVYSVEQPNICAFCSINVVKKHKHISNIKLNFDKLNMQYNSTFKLVPQIEPIDVVDDSLVWNTSDQNIATVDDSGNVRIINSSDEIKECWITVSANDKLSDAQAKCRITVFPNKPGYIIGTEKFLWGDITVKCKLTSDKQCILLNKNDDNENGYISGSGTLVVPDYVEYNNVKYYVTKIPSDWSDGENDITGVIFTESGEKQVKHLTEICDYAFYKTNALNYYCSHKEKLCVFPNNLKRIGQCAFYGTSYSVSDKMRGYSFPSTLTEIGDFAFKTSPYIDGYDNNGEMFFHGVIDKIGEQAFYNTWKHDTKYIFASTIDVANTMASKIAKTGDFNIGGCYLQPTIKIIEYFRWGDINVKCKLISENNECVLVNENDDGEIGYVSGSGVLVIPDYVEHNKVKYYVKKIPSDWSDGENDIKGVTFTESGELRVRHLTEICDYAFAGTNALWNYLGYDSEDNIQCVRFPEGVKRIGKYAFYKTAESYSYSSYIKGYIFPKSLEIIDDYAFFGAPLIGYINSLYDPYSPARWDTMLQFCSYPKLGKNIFCRMSADRHAAVHIYTFDMQTSQKIADELISDDDFHIHNASGQRVGLIPLTIE